MTLLVKDYDEAIDFYVNRLGFLLVEDTPLGPAPASGKEKRWVIVAPPGSTETALLLAEADGHAQEISVGQQAGGRVFLFLRTDDFWRDYRTMRRRGIQFVEDEPREESYGTVIVFEDLYGNRWDLIESEVA